MNVKRKKDKLAVLNLVKSTKRDKRNTLLDCLSDNTCEVLYEAISNVITNGAIKQARRKKLKSILEKEKAKIRYIVKRKNNSKRKKLLLKGLGGNAFEVLISAAIPLLLSLL